MILSTLNFLLSQSTIKRQIPIQFAPESEPLRLCASAVKIGKFQIWHLAPGKVWLEIIGAEGMATDEAKLEAHLDKFFTREF